MKLATSAAPIEISGGNSTSSFSIAMNGKAFRVLSDTLYQNKIGSIVREISCNAYDAHVMSGKTDVPFVIHLPDSFEPWFSVQDFGVGLSPEDIVNVFTVYFQSTKDNSNDAVGAFGLGAKTPFSYTDQFTVTSVKNGVRRIYSAFITESGVPSIIEMDSSPTKDINGVEIKMSVKREDYNKFSHEVASQLRFFKVKPVVKNCNGFKFQDVSNNLVIETADVAISDDLAGYGQAWAHVIQGNVGYPLDINQIKEKISADNRRVLDALSGFQTRFYFNIGEIGVTASREGIEYNKHTLTNIENKLTAVRKELTDYVNNKLKALTGDWEKALFINSSPAIGRFARGADINIPNVKRGSNGMYHFDFSSILLDKNKKNQYGHALTIGKVSKWVPHKVAREQTGNAVLVPSKNDNVVIVLRDTANKPNIRAKHYLSQLGSKYELLEIDMFDPEFSYDDAFIKELKGLIGGYDNIKRLSEIEPPARETVAKDGTPIKRNYTRPAYYTYKNGEYSNVRNWEREFEPLSDNTEDTAYVFIEDMVMDTVDSNAVTQYALFTTFSKKFLPLVAIRKSDAKKIEGMNNYISLVDYIAGQKAAINANKKLYFKWRHANMAHHVSKSFHYDLLTEFDTIQAIAPRNKVTKALRIAKKSKVDTNMTQIAEFAGWTVDSKQFDRYSDRAGKIVNGMFNEYPLVKLYADWTVRRSITIEHLAKYLSKM